MGWQCARSVGVAVTAELVLTSVPAHVQFENLLLLEELTRGDIKLVYNEEQVDIVKASILYDVKPQGKEVFLPQCAHLDYRLVGNLDRKIFVSITALTAAFRLIIWPGSQVTMQELVAFHACCGEPEYDAQGNPNFKKNSSVEKDVMFAQNFNMVRPIVLTIWPGQTIVFHGMTVHAGAPGRFKKDGSGEVEPCFRLHRYIMPKGSEIELD